MSLPTMEREVRAEAKAILKEADLQQMTSRKLRDEVAKRLKVQNIEQYRQLIEGEVEEFIERANAPPLPEVKSTEKRKAAAEPVPDQLVKRANKVHVSAPSDSEEFELSDTRKITLREYGGKQLIDIREYYMKEGKLNPGSKGLALSPQQWAALAANLSQITKAAEDGDADFAVDLGNKKRAFVSEFKGKHNVQLRECYEKNSELLPGKKGIALPLDQWGVLCSYADKITAVAEKGSTAERSKEDGAGPSKKDAVGPADEGAAAPSAEQAISVDLSQNRRASVSDFKGRMLLNMREYYEADGEMRPGKKGISLTKDQAQKLKENADCLSNALAAKEIISVPLGNKRYAKVKEYKGTCMIDVREFYEKDGEEKPGLKGLSMPSSQWNMLLQHLDSLVSQL